MNRRLFVLAAGGSLCAAPGPVALPSARQLAHQAYDLKAFLHFSINTFTDREWGLGDEDPNLFQPSALDADAIVGELVKCGFKGFILTCKHHDGFCLWPTRTTEHSVRRSSWKGGKGDVVREFADAGQRHKLPFGVYLSPWDRNNAAYGKPEYPAIYRRQLTELLSNYGPIFEVWHDGANGGDGYYGGAREKRTIDKHTYYGWPETWNLVRMLQPNAVIFSDVGPDLRWVGNEKGIAGDPCWETYDPVSADGGPAAPGDVREKESATGTFHGSRWMPAECDVSIRPGWFWHAAEDNRVKTPAELLELYFQSVGRGASLLLNVPPNREGRLASQDIAALRGFARLRESAFANQVSSGQSLTRPVTFDLIRLREDTRFGQRIERVQIKAKAEGSWRQIAEATSIGLCRLIRLERPVTAEQIHLLVEPAARGKLSEVALFLKKA